MPKEKQRWLLNEVPPEVWEKANEDKVQKWSCREKKPRKNPYPVRSPSRTRDPQSITLKCTVYDIFKENPRALLDKDIWRNKKATRPRIKHPSVFETTIDKTRPAPPPMAWDDLVRHVDDLELDNSSLEIMKKPKLTWRGEPSDVSNLPHIESLHRVERQVISILRMTPDAYMQTKYVILAAAREYGERGLSFRKVDAQRVVRIDVSKACKLWEFFRQSGWIKV
jgi:hypothetical protein